MPITSGTKLGPYEIVGAIGAGGMGEVYRARDTRLGRDVAIKILPQHLTAKANVKQRFEREARAISSLQHPNICTLYDVGHQDGTDFLVMEYLEGETLADRLVKGPLAPEQVLKIGIEICEGLEKAHRTGVAHRDLKPGNIMLTKTGAKLLDFGLAKPLEVVPAASLTALPTSSRAMEVAAKPVTTEGTIVGTFQYMSPEQLEGKEADARSDIFALGAVLYEMAAGRRAFEGKSQTSVIAAILEREPPPISSLQPMSPPQLDRVVKLRLKKDPDERIQSAHDVKLQLEWIRDAGSQAGVPAPVVAHRKHRERLAWAGMIVFAIVAAVFAIGYIVRAPVQAPPIISEISPPANAKFVFSGTAAGPPVLSPDGQRLAFTAVGSDGRQRLWVRTLNASIAQPLEGTDGATYPFWSPDSHDLGFFANGKLNRIDASGGPSLALCEATLGRGGSWGQDGTIIFTPNVTSSVFRVPASGGTPRQVTKLEGSVTGRSHRWPQFLPDGEHFLLFLQTADAASEAIYAASLNGGEPKLLIRNPSAAVYAPPGYLLFVRQGTLMAQRFDAASLRLTGDAVPLAEHVETNTVINQGVFAASENGIVIYEAGEATGRFVRLLWYGRSGKPGGEIETSGLYFDPAISPDGRKLALAVSPAGSGNFNIWVLDLLRGTRMRLTFSAESDRQPAWSPDGKSIAFASSGSGLFHVYQNASDGTGTTTPLVVDDAQEYDPSFSADGLYLLFDRQAAQASSHGELWALPLTGERKAFPVLQSQFDVFVPALSPNGKWLAYQSSESGRLEVYVVPFLHGTGKWEISIAGGTRPRWRQDGRELFYLSADNKIMSAEIAEQGSGLLIGKVQALFQANPITTSGAVYVVTGDGKKFLVASTTTQQSSSEPLTLVVNWPALLKKQ
ncbi:MAG TPA: protein kinase [Candidatus Acidoferrales bacterium]|nr:protein kinase [Candidatus Acidoferrales bacterium]